jgi:hypothetical protein
MNEPEEIDIHPHPFDPCDEPALVMRGEHCSQHCGFPKDDPIHDTEGAV